MKFKTVKVLRVLGCLYVTLAFLAALATRTEAQTTSGSIYGTVADSTGAILPNAIVTAKNINTGESSQAKSNDAGNYLFLSLQPGEYTVSTSMPGFQSTLQSGIRLSANSNVHANFALQAGSVQQTVEVSAATTLVDTRESQLGETIDQKRIEDLPLNGRNAYSLVALVPGVSGYASGAATGDNTGSRFNVNGERSDFDSFYLDGAYDNSVYRGYGNIIPNPDALQEFRVLTSNFDAEFGRSPGAVVNVITRSGTSKFHGLAYDYLRNNIFNAKSFFVNTVTPLKQNQFGGNFGGPIFRDKAFFFTSYEGMRVATTTTVNSSSLVTPTALEATGDFRSSPKKPNISCGGVQYVICPLDPVAVNLLKYVPVGSSSASNYGHPAQQNVSNPSVVDEGLGRLDYQLGRSHRLALTYFNEAGHGTNYTAGSNQILDYSGTATIGNQRNAVLSDNWEVSANKVNDLRFFYTDNKTIYANLYTGNFLQDLGSKTPEGAKIQTQPNIIITGYWSMGTGSSGPINQSQVNYGLIDTFNWTHGKHSLKLGGSAMELRYSETGVYNGSTKFTYSGTGTGSTGNALADFLLGKATSLVQNSGVYHRLHLWEPALFVQDDWNVLRRLTLNLGLRWEAYPPFAGQNDLGTFVPGVESQRFPAAPLGLLSTGDPGVPDGVQPTSWKRLAPRVGFAYDVYGNGRTSLRGAYGVFYAADEEGMASNLEQEPFLLSVTTNNPSNMVNPYSPGASPFPYVVNLQNPTFAPGATMVSMKRGDASTPYVQEYNLTLEQQFGTNWSTRMAYVGSVSRKLYLTRDMNAPIYTPTATTSSASIAARRPYQPYNVIDLYDPAANASYSSLQTTVTRRFAHRFSLSASYVWAKAIDEVSGEPSSAGTFTLEDQYDTKLDRAASTMEVPQAFVASYLWAVPNVTHWGMLGKEVLSGWQINGITTLNAGSPFNVLSGYDTNADAISTDRPDLVGNPDLGGGRSRAAKIAEFFNTAAFAKPATGVPYGDAGRDPLRGPAYINTDLSAFKTFPIHETINLQFRGEVYNLFNTVNLSAPNATMTSSSFGKISGTYPARIVQFALRLAF